jgi:hypothetical protein
MASPTLLNDLKHGRGERKKEENRVQATEMRFLKAVKGCTRDDRIRNKSIRD